MRAAALGGSSARPAAGFALGRANRQLRQGSRSQSGSCSVCCAECPERNARSPTGGGPQCEGTALLGGAQQRTACWVEGGTFSTLLPGGLAPSAVRTASAYLAAISGFWSAICFTVYLRRGPTERGRTLHGQCRNLRPEGVPPTHGLHGRVCSGGEQRHKRVGAA